MSAGAAMSAEMARIVFFAIAAVMWVVWYIGTRFALSRLRPGRAEPGPPADTADSEVADAITGEAIIEGEAEAVSKKLAEQLVSAAGAGGAGAVRITERTPQRIVFEVGPGTASRRGGGHAGQAIDSGLIEIDPEGDRLRVRYAVSVKRFARIMRIVTYAVCFGYGGLVIVIVPLLIWMFVVGSAKEAVRWQVFQALQMVHGVWPPFLVGAIAGLRRRAAARFFDNLLANASYIA